MEPEQRKLPRLLCFIPTAKQDTAPQQNTEPPATTSQHRTERAATTVVAAMVLYAYLWHALSGCHENPRPSLPLLCRGLPVNVCLRHTSLHHACWVRRGNVNGAAMQLTQYTITTYHSTSTSDIYTRYDVIRVPPARIVWVVTETHDRRCRSSVVGYQ